MASNSFGNQFRITTWGESHGEAVGVVIDGCPAGLQISEEEINEEVYLRAPGNHQLTSPRIEKDCVKIMSGIYQKETTGAPISLIIQNQNGDSSKYEPVKHLLKPGHANYTYLEKYGVFDDRGGGRASARETVCRVAAGAIAKKILKHFEIDLIAYLSQVGEIRANVLNLTIRQIREKRLVQNLFCPDSIAEEQIKKLICVVLEEGDSIGGQVGFVIENLPVGLGEPIYSKIEANLAYAMLSLPASKGFEIGSGFKSTTMRGSQHNDSFVLKKDKVETATNFAGGTLGGLTNGMPLYGQIAFKPASSIQKQQQTLNLDRQESIFELPSGSKHDPCVAVRAVPVVEAMCALVIADALLLNRCVRL